MLLEDRFSSDKSQLFSFSRRENVSSTTSMSYTSVLQKYKMTLKTYQIKTKGTKKAKQVRKNYELWPEKIILIVHKLSSSS